MTLEHTGKKDDRAVGEAIATFLRRAAQGDVTVEFSGGVASLHGRVASRMARAAIEDLVSAHDGVEAVVNDLVVSPAAVPRPQPPGEEVQHRR